MITVLSPAKKLTTDCFAKGNAHTKPIFLDDSNSLVGILKNYKPDQLQTLMGISQNLSELNWERFQSWTSDYAPSISREAFFSFKGDTYNGLDAESLTEKDIIFAQDNVRILSGLYGLLKPLDLMLPYRLEMGTKLNNSRGKNLYEFWGENIANYISNELSNHRHKIIINCASNEYFKSIKNDALSASVITPEFKEVKNGTTKMISFYAKKARGMMAKFIIVNRIDNIKDILSFNEDGYSLDASLSTEIKPVFTRNQS
jgi:cytoplasmic iron level regulating protein YaaA (DUF328/UPF0246 family)